MQFAEVMVQATPIARKIQEIDERLVRSTLYSTPYQNVFLNVFMEPATRQAV